MTVSLELDREARARGIASRFVPTGQTGIAIAGWGISVDAVVADFIAGAAERLVVEGSERGGDLLLVEGQGSISHPAYSGVTLGLIHGSAPHAFVLCHMAGATEVEGYEGYPLLSLPELVALHEAISLTRRPAVVACIALNTRHLDDDEARAAIAEAEAETGLVADDPVRFGAGRLLDAVLAASATLVTQHAAGTMSPRSEDRGVGRRIGRSVRRTVATAVCLAALALAGSAPAADIGANDDTGKFAADAGAVFFAQMGALGLEAVGDDDALRAERSDDDPGRRGTRPRDSGRRARGPSRRARRLSRIRRARSRTARRRRPRSRPGSRSSRSATRPCSSTSS